MPRRISWSRALSALLLATGAVFMLAGAKLTLENSHFYGDDFLQFLLLLELPFWDYIVFPVDVHFVPLLRTASYVLFKIRPLDFPTAVFVMLTVHIAGTFYLYATLQALNRNGRNRLLAFLFATNVFVFAPLLWWSAGIGRYSYVLCAVASMYHFLRYRDSSSYRHLIAVVALVAAGIGFYSKGFLIPAYLLALEICLIPQTPRPRTVRNLLVAGILCLASALCFALTRAFVAAPFAGLHLDWGILLRAEAGALALLSRGMLTLIGRHEVLYGVLGAGFWLLLFLYSVAKRPFNAVVWLAGLGVVALNVAAIGVSLRAEIAGSAFVHIFRYYHELTFLVIVFLSLILNNSIGEARSRLLSKRGVHGVLRASLAGFVVAYAVSSYSHANTLLESRFQMTRQAKEFMDNLADGLGEIRAEGPRDVAFVNGRVPAHVMGGFITVRYSRFLRLFDLDHAVVEQDWKKHLRPPGDLYQIEKNGRLIRVWRSPRPNRSRPRLRGPRPGDGATHP